MNDLDNLHDAFHELEQRADRAPVTPFAVADRSGRRRTVRVLAPLGAAAVVAAAAVAIAAWPQSSPHKPVPTLAGGSSPVSSSTTSTTTPTPSPTGSATHSGRYLPPQSGAALTEQARQILQGTATITTTYESDPIGTDPGPQPSQTGSAVKANGLGGSTVPAAPSIGSHLPVAIQNPPATNPDSGAAIVGTLTADGRSGGFDLDVYHGQLPLKASCSSDEGNVCTVTRRPDGTSLAVGRWEDPAVPGGVTYEVDAVRPDGATILLHLSTEADPKGQSAVTSSTLPLTVRQMVDFVTSDQW